LRADNHWARECIHQAKKLQGLQVNARQHRCISSGLPLSTPPRSHRGRHRAKPEKNFVVLFAFFCVCLWLFPELGFAQEGEQEIVANLAAGRVVICVAHDAIILSAIEQKTEPGSHPPLMIPLSERRIAILLGATEWVAPASAQPPVRLDRELPRLLAQVALPRQQTREFQASDIETIGVVFLERLRAVASQLHHKIDLGAEEPLVALVLVDYLQDYGPEVWELRYRVAQEALRGNFWRTRVLRPSYTQLYPPEKGKPRTLMEVRYPPDEKTPALLDLLKQDDPRLARIRSGDPKMARVADQLIQGESPKAQGADAAALLRAALGAVVEPDAQLVLAVLYEEQGFQWVLAPPELPEKAEDEKPREPGAPTLRKKPKPPQ
jgi:hypothetical protein